MRKILTFAAALMLLAPLAATAGQGLVSEQSIEINAPPAKVGAAEIDTYKDHRVAMSFAVAAVAAPGIIIRDPECVSKSFPGFFEQLGTLGIKARRI